MLLQQYAFQLQSHLWLQLTFALMLGERDLTQSKFGKQLEKKKIKRNYRFKILKKKSEGFHLLKNEKGDKYDVVEFEIIDHNGETLGNVHLDVISKKKGGWVNMFSEQFEMRPSSLGHLRFKMIPLKPSNKDEICPPYSKITLREFNNQLKHSIENDCAIIMARNSPQDQLLAGGRILMALEIADSLELPIRQVLSRDKAYRMAFDFVTEMRHYDCNALIERNKKLK